MNSIISHCKSHVAELKRKDGEIQRMIDEIIKKDKQIKINEKEINRLRKSAKESFSFFKK